MRIEHSTTKNFWKVEKFLTKKNSSIPTLKNGERVVENDLDKATLLNSYLSVSPLTDDDIAMFDSTNPLLCREEFLCTEDEVIEMLLSLDTKKANGQDGILARMLKSTAPSIVYSIALLFNNSTSTRKIPRAWKVSSVVPVPKGSDSTCINALHYA